MQPEEHYATHEWTDELGHRVVTEPINSRAWETTAMIGAIVLHVSYAFNSENAEVNHDRAIKRCTQPLVS